MLRLNIEQGDKILIGEGDAQIVVSFDRLAGAVVSLGVNAPREIPVHTIFADTSKQFKNRANDNKGNV